LYLKYEQKTMFSKESAEIGRDSHPK